MAIGLHVYQKGPPIGGGVGWVIQGWGGSQIGGVGHAGVGGSCRGRVGHTGVGGS